MKRLVPVTTDSGPEFVTGLLRAWDAGDAVLPVDHRLPAPARGALLEAMRAGEPVEPDDALVVSTSGTTGEPKGVVLTHEAVAAAAVATGERLAVDPTADRWLACLPLAHAGGLGVVTRALLMGTALTFDLDDELATLASMVPTQLERLDVSRFRAVLVGGSADWRERPANVVHTYGLTETGGGVVYDGVALADVDIRIGVDGEIHVRGPILLRGYRDGTNPRDAEGWLPTRDAGHWDGQGRLVVDGRLDDAIVTGGENVWPATVEALLRAHGAIADVVVMGRPDPEWGQRVVAVVVAADPSAPPSLDELRAWVKERAGPWAAPRELELTDDLPRTALGKVRRGQNANTE